MEVPGILLAGGRSSRMGQEKALIKLGDTSLVSMVLSSLRKVCSPVILVTNTPCVFKELEVTVLTDEEPFLGPMGGLLTGMKYAGTSHVFACACDTPFLKPELVRLLAGLRFEGDAVAPLVRDIPHPLPAVYSTACIPIISAQIQIANYSLSSVFPQISVRFVTEEEIVPIDPDFLSFLNINQPTDLLRARKIWEDRVLKK